MKDLANFVDSFSFYDHNGIVRPKGHFGFDDTGALLDLSKNICLFDRVNKESPASIEAGD